jgi:hypothetical protein
MIHFLAIGIDLLFYDEDYLEKGEPEAEKRYLIMFKRRREKGIPSFVNPTENCPSWLTAEPFHRIFLRCCSTTTRLGKKTK